MIVLIWLRSIFGCTIDEVQSLISCRNFGGSARPGRIIELNLPKDSQHIAQSETQDNRGRDEPKCCQSLRHVGDEGWHFISQVKIFFVVDMVSSHFQNQVIKGTSAAKIIVSL